MPRKDEDELMNNRYEIHILELWNKKIDVKKIVRVMYATYAVMERKPDRLAGIPLSCVIVFTFGVDTCDVN